MATNKKAKSASSSPGGGGSSNSDARSSLETVVIPLIHDSMTFCNRQMKGIKEMEKQAEVEIKRRRKEWEREVDRMREEFLRLYPVDEGQGHGGHAPPPPPPPPPHDPLVAKRRGSTDFLDEKKMQTMMTDHPDASSADRKFRLRFDLSGFNGDDIVVYTDADRIVVRSSRTDVVRGGVSARREYVRKIQRPKEVEANRLQSYLTTDGILVVEAVIASSSSRQTVSESSHRSHGGGGGGGGRKDHHHHHHHHHRHRHHSLESRQSPPPPPHPPPQGTGSGPETPPPGPQTPATAVDKVPVGVPTFKDESGRRRLLLVVEIGKLFRPKDVTVQVIRDNRLMVKARHEDINSERLVKGKFSKEFELAERIETESVRGGIDGEGRLVVGAFVKGQGIEMERGGGGGGGGSDDGGEEFSMEEFDPKSDLLQCNVLNLSSFPPTMPASAAIH